LHRKACGAVAYGQAVWSCHLDAGVKFVESRFRPNGRNAEINKRRGLTSPIPRGEYGVSRKAIAQGVPDRFGEPVVTLLVGLLPFSAHEAAGALSARHSLRPLLREGQRIARLGREIAPREREDTSLRKHVARVSDPVRGASPIAAGSDTSGPAGRAEGDHAGAIAASRRACGVRYKPASGGQITLQQQSALPDGTRPEEIGTFCGNFMLQQRIGTGKPLLYD
jgi:hypothetical protein